MAAYTSSKAKTFTPATSVVDTLVLTGTGKYLRVAHNSSSSAVYFVAEPTGTTATTATVGGDNNFVVFPTQWFTMAWPGTGANISVITAGTSVAVNFSLHD